MFPTRTNRLLAVFVCCGLAVLFIRSLSAAEPESIESAKPLLKQFCFECHEGREAEANIDLPKLLSDASLESTFKDWQKVVDMLQQRKMPPKEMQQPTDVQRQELTARIRGELRRAMDKHAGDPGTVLVR